MDGEARRLFASLAWMCRAVVCCRMTPMQKAEVVELIQGVDDEHIVLAIGNKLSLELSNHVFRRRSQRRCNDPSCKCWCWNNRRGRNASRIGK
jgi:hypothetical protein